MAKWCDTYCRSVSDRYIAAIGAGLKFNPETMDILFKELPPVKPDQLIGDCNGGFFDTGHPFAAQLNEIQWVGKSFKSLEDVDPVIVNRDGERVSWGEWGFASVSFLTTLRVRHTPVDETDESHIATRDGIRRGCIYGDDI